MSALGQQLEEYLAIRRSLGFKLVGASYQLADFVGFMDRTGAATVTTGLAVAWATTTRKSANSRASCLATVRGFASYLQAIDPGTEVPSANLLPRYNARAVPYIYSDDEIFALMVATQTLHSPIRRCTYATLIGLLAVTGMRGGEAVRLDRDDVNWQQGFLTVRNTKFGKSREVALHPSTAASLASYSQRRDELILRPGSPSFFVSQTGTRLILRSVQLTYRVLVRHAGLRSPSLRCRPRIHDLRHTFAVRTVLKWYREELDVEARLPLLSTYLGHASPTSTYWYLSATPELLSLASERLQRLLGDRS